jgi:cytochrome P450
MALHPDVQRKAQAQIDEVVGTSRLPEFEDVQSLPYIVGLVKELLRWQPITPLGALPVL